MRMTHKPAPNGALCGKRPAPAHASDYTAQPEDEPTCEACAKLVAGFSTGAAKRRATASAKAPTEPETK